jgi:hypothetical protein
LKPATRLETPTSSPNAKGFKESWLTPQSPGSFLFVDTPPKICLHSQLGASQQQSDQALVKTMEQDFGFEVNPNLTAWTNNAAMILANKTARQIDNPILNMKYDNLCTYLIKSRQQESNPSWALTPDTASNSKHWTQKSKIYSPELNEMSESATCTVKALRKKWMMTWPHEMARDMIPKYASASPIGNRIHAVRL